MHQFVPERLQRQLPMAAIALSGKIFWTSSSLADLCVRWINMDQ
jgi:hypothetical protein